MHVSFEIIEPRLPPISLSVNCMVLDFMDYSLDRYIQSHLLPINMLQQGYNDEQTYLVVIDRGASVYYRSFNSSLSSGIASCLTPSKTLFVMTGSIRMFIGKLAPASALRLSSTSMRDGGLTSERAGSGRGCKRLRTGPSVGSRLRGMTLTKRGNDGRIFTVSRY